MFSALQEPDLADRLRAAAAWPLGAYLLIQVQLTLYTLLLRVPRWLVEALRIELAIGLLGGIFLGLWVALRGPRERPTLRAAGWLAALVAGLLLCGWTLRGFP